MATQTEVLKLALEMLKVAQNNLAPSKWSAHVYGDGELWDQYAEAITAIKKALAQPEQEPVAIVDANDEGYWAEILPDRSVKVGQFLFAHPPVPTAEQENDAVEVLIEEGWIWDGDQWQRPPVPTAQPEHGWTFERIAGIDRLKEAQDKKLAQPEQRSVSEHLEPTKLWCETCEGTGEVYQEYQKGCHVGGHFKCPDCNGEGHIVSRMYCTTPYVATPLPHRTWVGLMRGVRVEGDTVVITVKGGNDAARELCGELLKEKNT